MKRIAYASMFTCGVVRHVTISSTNGTLWTVKRCTVPNKYFLSTVPSSLGDVCVVCGGASDGGEHPRLIRDSASQRFSQTSPPDDRLGQIKLSFVLFKRIPRRQPRSR